VIFVKNIDKNISDFLETEYYRRYLELLNNEKLKKLCEEKGFSVKFYLHREAQRFSDCFFSDNKNLIICKYPEYRVDELLKSSTFLITDYSSIQTDFAYMKKPICYFQFDYERFSKEHYRKGYFDYEKDGFGPAFATADEVVRYVAKRAETGFENPLEYRNREDEFFDLYDTDNCKRNFEAIKKKWS
jgi:CDP-glycerol glycerophosphotransferase (TagB/SpsB family)